MISPLEMLDKSHGSECGSSMRFCSKEIVGRLANWLRRQPNDHKGWKVTGSIPGGGRSVMKAYTEGIGSGGMEVKGNSYNFCTMRRFA